MDLIEHLKRQLAFSRATFGPGERRAGVCDHVRKELGEIMAADDPRAAADEWVDVVILGLDGLTRALAAAGVPHADVPELAVECILRKQAENEQRSWPDWRTAPADKAIEHVRGEA